MAPLAEEVLDLLARLVLAGPAGYLGLWIAMNPTRVLRLTHDLEVAILRFRDALRWSEWRQPLSVRSDVSDSPGARLFIRLLGAALTLYSLLVFAGIGG